MAAERSAAMAILSAPLNQGLSHPRQVTLLVPDTAFPRPLSAYCYAEFKR